jgi:MscS family membrane protein
MEFLDKIIFDNSLRSYSIVFAIIFLAFLTKKLLSHYVASLLFILVSKRWKFVTKQEFTALTLKPLAWFLVIVIAVFALDKLHYPSAFLYKIKGVGLNIILEKIGDGAIIISFIYFLISGINFIAYVLEKSSEGPNDKSFDQVVVFFRDLLKIALFFTGLMLVLKVVFNQNIGALLTGLSIVGAGLALAAKESLENLIASFIIFIDKPFFTGDTVKVNNVSGTIEHIGLRSTRIRTPERTLVTVPNKQMVDSVVDNMSLRNLRRAEFKLVLSEKSTATQIQKLMTDVKNILNTKENEITKSSVFFTEYSKDGIVIFVEYFTPPFSRLEYDNLKQYINFSLMKLMEENGLEMNAGGNNINIINSDGVVANPKNSNLL